MLHQPSWNSARKNAPVCKGSPKAAAKGILRFWGSYREEKTCCIKDPCRWGLPKLPCAPGTSLLRKISEHFLYNHTWLGYMEGSCVFFTFTSNLKHFHSGRQGPHTRDLPAHVQRDWRCLSAMEGGPSSSSSWLNFGGLSLRTRSSAEVDLQVLSQPLYLHQYRANLTLFPWNTPALQAHCLNTHNSRIHQRL